MESSAALISSSGSKGLLHLPGFLISGNISWLVVKQSLNSESINGFFSSLAQDESESVLNSVVLYQLAVWTGAGSGTGYIRHPILVAQIGDQGLVIQIQV